MAGESIDFRFLAEQGKSILDELVKARSERAESRAEQKSLAEVVGKLANAVIAIAVRQDHHTEVLTHKLYEIRQTTARV